MFFPNGVAVNAAGHLEIGGVDTVELAHDHGTPLYVMNERTIRETLRNYKKSIDENYENGGMVAFASKACSFTEMYRLVMEEGCGADIASGGELYTAMKVGFPAERLVMHGNCKSESEIRMALDYGVGRIVLNDMYDLNRVARVARKMGKTANVYLRITPGIEAHTHSSVMTGQIDSKFGFTLETGEAMEGIRAALSTEGVALKGLHCHIASQVFDEKPFEDAAEIMLTLLCEVREKTGVTLGELDLGGGFGIPYTEKDHPKDCTEYMRLVAGAVREKAHSLDFPLPYIVIEPGRSVVATAGVTLYTVGAVKKIPNVRTYVAVDGGMCDNPRYALYQADYTALIADRAGEASTETVTIAGRCCESGDLLQENAPLQSCDEGDVLAVLCTGAYNYSMSSNYNRYPKPPVLMVKDGKARVVVKGETYEDILRNDV